MQLAIQSVSHNTILVSSRPGRHADGCTAEIASPGPKLLATLQDWPTRKGNHRPAHVLQLCDFRIVLEAWTG